MNTSVAIKLDNARNLLRELGDAINHLEVSYPDIFHNPEIKSQLESFRRAHEEAVARLANPRLCIATLGTTSSGKSTIVNALIGRRIAPIEAGEMSGGVLTFHHSHENKLVVNVTEGAEWFTGERLESRDEELYKQIYGVMKTYHTIRKNKECMAPQVKVFGSILPAVDLTLLGLPEGVEVELIDLPGLKSVQDRANLAVIQEQIPKAFSIVALDYAQVDDEHRKRLLEELKRVVQYLQGRTDSMLFILNRVDLRGSDDIPIADRIRQLRGEIQQVLSLEQPPEVIPFSARLLYYAQCAWGTAASDVASLVDQATRLKLLKEMLIDCAALIQQQTDQDRNLRLWFFQLGEDIREGEYISDEKMRQILEYALNWSGGRHLWNQLQTRVQESFSELVILPALVEILDSYDALARAFDTLADIRKIETKEAVDAELKRIAESRHWLNQNIQNLRQEFLTYIAENIDALKKNDLTIRSRLAQQAKEKGRRGFQTLFEAVDVVEGDLAQNLISPVRDALNANKEVYLLKEALDEVTTPVLIERIGDAYDSASRRTANFTPVPNDDLFKRAREDDRQGVKGLEVDELAVRRLYQVMRDALSTRAEFILQTQAKKIEAALQGLIDEQEKALGTLCIQQLPLLKLDQAIMAAFKQNASQNLPTLPEKFFEIPLSIGQNTSKEQEVVGKENVTQTYTEGSCFKQEKTKTVVKDVMGDVAYCELKLPNANKMAQQWAEGIAQGKDKLWDILSAWIIERLNFASNVFDKSVDEVISLAEHELQQQKKIIEDNFEAELQRWNEIEQQKAEATKIWQKLTEESRTSHVVEEK
ncbi:dynamin family protein [Nostoc parmelioides]|uniref:Dynamin family protein n=1 Tax=Nostoc parmelioides FACHB-3921 TaxID=2692909 RepID=A0ABR8BLG5_9NOSO|nr:dynamin family protein [Nostoc parmelioides]MBD2254937.1 dynamin family protein [Nostoc parmelioides FACHB-3921]